MNLPTKHKVPDFGWKVKLDHQFPELRDQNFIPSLRVIFGILTLIIRYFLYEVWCFIRGRSPVMDYVKPICAKQIYGVPLGGIGGGTIGRGFAGEFCRFQLKPGFYDYEVIDADQFIVSIRNLKNVPLFQNVLTSRGPPNNGHLHSWKWNFPGSQARYTALYPRAWTEYCIPECNVRLVCRQISPVIPHNYKDSSLPGSVFVWSVENNSEEPLYVTVAMCFKGHRNTSSANSFDLNENGVKVHGVEMENDSSSPKCTFSVGAKENEFVEVTSATFNPYGTGAVIWDQLRDRGGFKGKLRSPVKFFGEIACAVAAQTLVPNASFKSVEFSLVWHIPFVHFRDPVVIHERFYTKYFGSDKLASSKMCHYSLTHYDEWEQAIDAWQNPILSDDSLPTWYKSAIFNELYYISDGGTVWFKMTSEKSDDLPINDTRKEFGQFAYLEGHEYRMYNTYDVHFYASFALADLWPKLQLSLQYEICDTISRTDQTLRWFLFDGHFGRRKLVDCVPHDIGDPDDEPFLKINAYPVHDVSDWKDLNLKFVLQCYRDYLFTKDEPYVQAMWPSVKLLMNKCLVWDKDGDGMIENGGFPDQTYDTWTMSGVSSYCGSLWLAALYATKKMASLVGDEETKSKFDEIFKKATNVFTKKLWNGSYYDFDTASQNSKSIMADQLCGIWYLRASGIHDEILPKENISQALSTIFEYNVERFKNGEIGAVNGMLPNGEVDMSNVQSQEVWTGVTYALASHFISCGMKEKGFATAKGVYETVYNKIGMAFCTPEALYKTKHYRSVSYMRPLSIWSMQIALRNLKSRTSEPL